MKLLRLFAATPFLLASAMACADGTPADMSPTVATTATPVAAAPAPAPTVVASADKEAKVCRMERTIGSNMAKRVCRTKAQLEAEAEEARRSMSSQSERGN